MQKLEEHIVIIGNGISGITCARHIRKNSNKQITVISGESEYFFSRTALMYVYMGHMKFEHTQPYEKWFWKKNKIDLIHKFVTGINTLNNTIQFKDNSVLSFDKLVIATGSKPNKFGWPGQELSGVTGMYHKNDLENIERFAPDNKTCKRAVIVGGGLIGIELAEMLHSRNIPTTFLVREKSFWGNVLPSEESAVINKEITDNHIDLRLGVNLKEINADDNGNVKSITIAETGEIIDCDLVGLTAGVTPNIDFLKASGIKTAKGIIVNRYLETNIPNIYAIGDCAEQEVAIDQRRPIEAVWYTGRMMGETVAQTICSKKTAYKPGHWFNSAKFLDIEYQTYGWVFSEKNKKENEVYFQWKHPKEQKCITISFDKTTQQFLGINTFGIRLRHEIFDTWLTENKTIAQVLEYLADANFDPEFYKVHEPEIVAKFNLENNTNIHPKKKSWKRIFSKS